MAAPYQITLDLGIASLRLFDVARTIAPELGFLSESTKQAMRSPLGFSDDQVRRLFAAEMPADTFVPPAIANRAATPKFRVEIRQAAEHSVAAAILAAAATGQVEVAPKMYLQKLWELIDASLPSAEAMDDHGDLARQVMAEWFSEVTKTLEGRAAGT